MSGTPNVTGELQTCNEVNTNEIHEGYRPVWDISRAWCKTIVTTFSI